MHKTIRLLNYRYVKLSQTILMKTDSASDKVDCNISIKMLYICTVIFRKYDMIIR